MSKIHEIVFPGTLPGLNEYIYAERTSKYLAAELKRRVENAIMLTAKSQLCGACIDVPVFISYIWTEPNARRDKDNIAFAKKFIQDGLIKAGILGGDGWSHIEGFSDTFKIDKLNPQVSVFLHESVLCSAKKQKTITERRHRR